MRKILSYLPLLVIMVSIAGCNESNTTSDAKQQTAQEKIEAEGNAQVGMPAIKNFRERKILKDILELRDQNGLITYTYAENAMPVVVHGKTSDGGKYTYIGQTIGYPIPYATQFTNPQKIGYSSTNVGVLALPQCDPNCLFSPASAEATWVLMLNPTTNKTEPQYLEGRIQAFTFKRTMD